MKKVQFTRVNSGGFVRTLFNVESGLDILEISDCSLGTLNYTFLKAKTSKTKIINNRFTLDQDGAFIIEARNWSVAQNKILKVKGSMELRSQGVNSWVHIENNEVEFSKQSHETDNIFHLNFETRQRLDTVKIENTNLGELRRKFISDISVDTLEISGCRLTLENEDILDLSVRRFIFVNNQVENIISEAFRLRVGELGQIENNTFQHVQLESFARIAPGKPAAATPSLEIKNNWIENFESGFLIIQQNWIKLQIENIFLHKSCDCQLNPFTRDQIKVINNEVLVETVVRNTYCTKVELVNFYDFSREHCSDSPEQITEVFWIAIREGKAMEWKIDFSPLLSCHSVMVSLNQTFSIADPPLQWWYYCSDHHHRLGCLAFYQENRGQNQREGSQQIHRSNIQDYGVQN